MTKAVEDAAKPRASVVAETGGVRRVAATGTVILAFRTPIIEESKLVLRVERQLDHALEKLIPGNAAKISQHELLDIEPYQITQFERLDTRGEHKIAMAVVHDDHVARRIEAGAP